MQKLLLFLSLILVATPSYSEGKDSSAGIIARCKAKLLEFTTRSAPKPDTKGLEVEIDIQRSLAFINLGIENSHRPRSNSSEAEKKLLKELELQAKQNFSLALRKRSLKDPLLSKYVPDQLLGIGGYGMVIKAWDRDLRKWVALKIQNYTSQTMSETFEKEFLIGKQAEQIYGKDSPVAHSYDHFTMNKASFHVMEYLGGGNLNDKWRDLEAKEVSSPTLMKENIEELSLIAQQIKKLHTIGFLHLDLKPQNIVSDSQNSNIPKIVDTGLAVNLDPLTRTADEKPKGQTPNYAAPELKATLEGKASFREVSTATDVFALGKMFQKRFDDFAMYLDGKNLSRFEAALKLQLEILNQDLVEPSLANDPNKRPPIERFIAKLDQLAKLIDTFPKDDAKRTQNENQLSPQTPPKESQNYFSNPGLITSPDSEL